MKPHPNPIGFNDDERAFVDAVLAFANLQEVTEDATYALAAPWGVDHNAVVVVDGVAVDRQEIDGKAYPITVQRFKRFRETGDVAVEKLIGERDDLRKLLALVRQGSSARRRLTEEIAPMLEQTVPVTGHYSLDISGNLVCVQRPVITGMEAFTALGVALLIDRSRPFGARIRKCPLTRCERWHLRGLSTTKGTRGGRPSEFCCPEHQKEFNDAGASERSSESKATRRRARHK